VAGEYRRTFFHKRARCFFVILGPAGQDLVPGLKIEKRRERAALSGVEILFHQGEGDARTTRQLTRKQHGRFRKLGIGDHPIDNPEREGLGGIDRFGGEIQLACPAGADKLGQK
jgi:hypothetical protein